MHFQQKELAYLQDTDFLLTKRRVIQQLQGLLAESQDHLKQSLKDWKTFLPPNCLQRAGKISRGENYRGLPYLVLDYPRLLAKDDVFSLRTMFWWGNFFSCTLHLQGKSLQHYRPQLQKNLLKQSELLPADTWISVNSTTPWEYHYQPSNYRLLKEVAPNALGPILEGKFVKLSRKISLQQYEQLPSFSSKCLLQFLACLRPAE